MSSMSIFSPSFRNALNHMNNLIDAYQNTPSAKIDAILLEFNYLKGSFTRLSIDEKGALNTVESRIRLALQTENARKRALSFSQDEPMPPVKRSALKSVLITPAQVILPVQHQPEVIVPRTYEEYPAEAPAERAPSRTPVGTPLDKLSPTLFLEERQIDEGECDPVEGESHDFSVEEVDAAEVPAIAIATAAPTRLKRAETINFDQIEPAVSKKPTITVMPTPLRRAQVNLTEMERKAIAAASVIQLIQEDLDGSEYGSI